MTHKLTLHPNGQTVMSWRKWNVILNYNLRLAIIINIDVIAVITNSFSFICGWSEWSGGGDDDDDDLQQQPPAMTQSVENYFSIYKL